MHPARRCVASTPSGSPGKPARIGPCLTLADQKDCRANSGQPGLGRFSVMANRTRRSAVIASKLYCIPTGPLSNTKRGASRSQRFRRLFGVLSSIASAGEAGRCQASLPTHPLCFNRFPDPFGDDRCFNGDRRRPLACILLEWRTPLDRALLRCESPRVSRPPVRSQRPFADSARPSRTAP